MDHSSIKVPWEPGLDLGAGFVRPWTPVRRSLLYRVSLVLVAAAMLLVPVAYLALVGVAAYLTYWHATHNLHYFTTWSGGGGRASARAHGLAFLLGYVGPIAAGVLVVVSMLKPLVVPRGTRSDGQLLDASREPVVYAFVTRMCEVMGAPAPTRIEVSGDINASAGTRGGIIGSLFSRQLVLVIGLPLVTGMSLNQLAGVIAHELGHFCQGAGMRAKHMIVSVQGWLVRAVFERDALDWWLVDMSRAGGSVAMLLVGLARLCVGFARAVLWVLLMTSHAVTMGLARQMEHDADRHESRFAGSATFESAAIRLAELQEAHAVAAEEINDLHRRNQLPDDVPALIADAASRLSGDSKARVLKSLETERSSWFGSHPPTRERIALARARAEEGIFHLDRPARVLFKDLRPLCVRASKRHFREVLEEDALTSTAVSTADLLRVNSGHTARLARTAAFLGFEPPDWRPLFPATTELEGAVDPKGAIAKLKEARASARASAPAAADAAVRFREADRTLVQCGQVEAHFQAGLRSLPREFKFPARSRDAARRLADESRGAAADAAAVLDEAMEAGSARLVWALRVLLAKGAERALPNAERLRARAAVAYPALIALRDCLGPARDLRAEFARATFVLTQLTDYERSPEPAKKVVRASVDAIREHLARIRTIAGAAKYPFEHTTEEITVAGRLVDDTPAWRDITAILSTADRALTRYPEEARRVLGELVDIAATVEEALAARARAAPGGGRPGAGRAEASPGELKG